MINTKKTDIFSFYLILFYLLLATNWENFFIFLVVWSLLSTIADKKVKNVNKDDVRWIIFLAWLILFFYFSIFHIHLKLRTQYQHYIQLRAI